ncbi:MAG: hypothetical protein ABI651_18390 [Verrucomicrobiota bacterium]
MKSFSVTCVCGIALLAATLPTRAQQFRWVKSGGGNDEDAGTALVVDAERNLYVAGHFSGTSTFGTNVLASSGGTDVFLVKMDSNGNFGWAVRAGGTNFDECAGVAVDPQRNILLTGYFAGQASFGNLALTSVGNSDIFIAKLDSTGEVLWAASAGGPAKDVANGIATDAMGSSYVTGSYLETASFGATNLTGGNLRQFFLAKYAFDGRLLWVRNTGGGENAVGNAVAADRDGNVWTVGDYYPLAPQDTRNSDLFIIRHDPFGRTVWYTSFGGSEAASAQAVALDESANCYVTGTFNGTAKFGSFTLSSRGDSDVFVLKCDPLGQVLWARKAGGSYTDVGSRITVDPEGSCLVAGYFLVAADFGNTHLTSGGSADAFVMKLDTDGHPLWAVQASGTANMGVYGLLADSAGSAYLTGYFRSSSPFGGFFLTNNSNGRDVFVCRLDNPPVPKLSIIAGDGNTIISWPSDTAGYRLENSMRLASPETWQIVTNVPSRIGPRTLVTNGISGGQRFYRLRRPAGG